MGWLNQVNKQPPVQPSINHWLHNSGKTNIAIVHIEKYWAKQQSLCLMNTGTALHLACTLLSVTHGVSSIMLWGAAGTGKLVTLEGWTSVAKYMIILQGNVIHSTSKLRPGRQFTFQHDNDLIQPIQHWSGVKSQNVLECLSQSTDLNPINHLWKNLKMEVQTQASKYWIKGLTFLWIFILSVER